VTSAQRAPSDRSASACSGLREAASIAVSSISNTPGLPLRSTDAIGPDCDGSSGYASITAAGPASSGRAAVTRRRTPSPSNTSTIPMSPSSGSASAASRWSVVS
jgi:hypothetical protein